jgi:hypothetical protein
VPCTMHHDIKNKRAREPTTCFLGPLRTSHSSNASFLYRWQLQSYLIRADMEKYPLINLSLVSVIMS